MSEKDTAPATASAVTASPAESETPAAPAATVDGARPAPPASTPSRASVDDFDDWDELDDEDELGWAVGTEFEFADEPVDDWDGPVGDGLDEEGMGGLARREPTNFSNPPDGETPKK